MHPMATGAAAPANARSPQPPSLRPTALSPHPTRPSCGPQVAHYLILTHLHTSGTVPPMVDVSTILPRARPRGAAPQLAGGGGAADVPGGLSSRARRLRGDVARACRSQLSSLLRAIPLPDLEVLNDLETKGLGCGILDLDDAFDADEALEEDQMQGPPLASPPGAAAGGAASLPAGVAAAAGRTSGGRGGGSGSGGGGRAALSGAAGGATRESIATQPGGSGRGAPGELQLGAMVPASSPTPSPAASPATLGGGLFSADAEPRPLGPEDALLAAEAEALAPPAVGAAAPTALGGGAPTGGPGGGAAAASPGLEKQQPRQQQAEARRQQASRPVAGRMEADDSFRPGDFPAEHAPGYGGGGGGGGRAPPGAPRPQREPDSERAPPRLQVPRWLRDTRLERHAAAAAVAVAGVQAPARGGGGQSVGGKCGWEDRVGAEASPAKRQRVGPFACEATEEDMAEASSWGGGLEGPGAAHTAALSPLARAGSGAQAPAFQPQSPPPAARPWAPEEAAGGEEQQQAAARGSGAAARPLDALNAAAAATTPDAAAADDAVGGGEGVYSRILSDVRRLLDGAAPPEQPQVAARLAAPLLQRCLDCYFQWDEARAVVDAANFPGVPGREDQSRRVACHSRLAPSETATRNPHCGRAQI
jgi:hypothetical protein